MQQRMGSVGQLTESAVVSRKVNYSVRDQRTQGKQGSLRALGEEKRQAAVEKKQERSQKERRKYLVKLAL